MESDGNHIISNDSFLANRLIQIIQVKPINTKTATAVKSNRNSSRVAANPAIFQNQLKNVMPSILLANHRRPAEHPISPCRSQKKTALPLWAERFWFHALSYFPYFPETPIRTPQSRFGAIQGIQAIFNEPVRS